MGKGITFDSGGYSINSKRLYGFDENQYERGDYHRRWLCHYPNGTMEAVPCCCADIPDLATAVNALQLNCISQQQYWYELDAGRPSWCWQMAEA